MSFVIKIFSASFFSILIAAQIAPEVRQGNAYQRLSVALTNHAEGTALNILIAEHDSLRSTQEGANLAIKACAIYGDIALYHGFLEPRVSTSFCCFVKYDSSCYPPDDKGIEAAYIEAAKNKRSLEFFKKIPLPADSKVRRSIYRRTFDGLIGSENVSDYLGILFYLADHLEDASAADSLKRNFVMQQHAAARANPSYVVSAQSFNDSDDDL
jgi:hypothetical protein